jgi:GMP synthase-like glutamine amidotransferase
MNPVLIRQHVEIAPPGRLTAWLDARGLAYELDRSWLGAPAPDPGDYTFVVTLGHDRGANDIHEPAVSAERELIERAVERDVPVLGLCYGGQMLAAVLGARVERAPTPELGWREVDTDDPSIVPAGPWLEWHYDRFDVPPGATEIARTDAAPQAFRLGPHVGVQFHPEATVEIVAVWARADAEQATAHGIDDAVALLSVPPEVREVAGAAAFRLFDGFLAEVSKTDHFRKRVAI